MSAVTADALDAVPIGPLATRIYLRHCHIPPPPEDPDPLWINAAAPSRWQSPGGTLYVAEDDETVMAEYCRNTAHVLKAADPTGGVGLNPHNFAHFASQPVGDPLPARAVFSVEIELDRVADIRGADAQEALRVKGIQPDDLLADDYGPCPALAQVGEGLGWQAVRAQSAANTRGTALAVFHGSHPAAPIWRVELEAGRPSVRIAYLTRYKAGERPLWLGR